MEEKPGRWDKVKSISFILVLVIAVLVAFIPVFLAVYEWINPERLPQWTGVGDYITPEVGQNQEFQRGKTLWDLVDFFIIPIVLALGAYFFNRSERRSELEIAERARETDREIAKQAREIDRRIAAERQYEATLQNYLDKMAEMLLKDNLHERKDSKDDPIVKVAQVRTVTTIRALDYSRRDILFQFLRDAKLADFILVKASLGMANLERAFLTGVDLRETILLGANLQRALLQRANLEEANLEEANLKEATLNEANLQRANLQRANLQRANLQRAVLKEADLQRAVLKEANLIFANLEEASLEEANLEMAIVSSANIKDAYLFRANLKHADLHGANLQGAYLQEANLQGANLQWAKLQGANLQGAILVNARVEMAMLEQALSLKDVTMPDGSLYARKLPGRRSRRNS